MKIDPKMPRMAFDRPRFNPGLNLTIRLGARWFLRVHGEGWSQALALDQHGKPIGLVGVEAAYAMPLSEVPAGWHLFNHDPAARSLAGIYEELKRVYPERDVSPDSLVTALFFRV